MGDKASLDGCGQKHQYQKNPASKAKFTEKKKNKFLRRSYNIYEEKFSNLRPFSSIIFPKDSENLKSLDIALREFGAKRRLNRVNK